VDQRFLLCARSLLSGVIMASSGAATVKAVPSGDTLLLMGRSTGGPPPELQLSLSGLTAPKVRADMLPCS
jgi:hypothetical protein